MGLAFVDGQKEGRRRRRRAGRASDCSRMNGLVRPVGCPGAKAPFGGVSRAIPGAIGHASCPTRSERYIFHTPQTLMSCAHAFLNSFNKHLESASYALDTWWPWGKMGKKEISVLRDA